MKQLLEPQGNINFVGLDHRRITLRLKINFYFCLPNLIIQNQMKTNSLATVIIPTYNRAKYIEKALDNVHLQLYRPLEVIIVDDGSTDNTEEIVADWRKYNEEESFEVFYYRQENAGAPAARNLGIKKSRGEYIQFYDTDDFITPEKIMLQIKKMKQENTLVCICDYEHLNDNREHIRTVRNNRSLSKLISSFMGKHTSIGVFKAILFKAYPDLRWNPKIKKRNDTDFYTKVFMTVEQFSYINKVLFQWIIHNEETITNTYELNKKAYWRLLQSAKLYQLKNKYKIDAAKKPAIYSYYKMLLYNTQVGYLYRCLSIFKESEKRD